MRILTVCAEFAPLAKVGGLADVTAGLAAFLAGRGHETVVILPRYGRISDAKLTLEERTAPRSHHVEIAGSTVRYACWPTRPVDSGPLVWLVDCPKLFGLGDIYADGERAAHQSMLLCRAALEFCSDAQWAPHVIHCHDWHAAFVPALLHARQRSDRLFERTRSVLTIHNIGYQGVFPRRVIAESGYPDLADLLADKEGTDSELNLLKEGIIHADAVTTVSPAHAQEIQGPSLGMGLDELLCEESHKPVGILNGVDYSCWNPETDPLIVSNYSADHVDGKRGNKRALYTQLGLEYDSGMPLIGLVSRFVAQKGIDLILTALPDLLPSRRFGCVFLGSGDPRYVEALTDLAAHSDGRMVLVVGHDETLAHRILAAADMLLVPSLYEPCGLTQLYALRYGTVPVVRATGGLADTVRHFNPETGKGNGCVFEHPDAQGLAWAIETTLDWFADRDCWGTLMRNGMHADCSWEHQGPYYEQLYERLIESTGG